MFGGLQAKWKNLVQVLVQKILHKKMFIRTDKISEIVNNSHSYGGSFSELSDSDTCKVHSPFSGGSSSSDSEKRKLFSQNLTEARREYAGPFLNAQIQVLI